MKMFDRSEQTVTASLLHWLGSIPYKCRTWSVMFNLDHPSLWPVIKVLQSIFLKNIDTTVTGTTLTKHSMATKKRSEQLQQEIAEVLLIWIESLKPIFLRVLTMMEEQTGTRTGFMHAHLFSYLLARQSICALSDLTEDERIGVMCSDSTISGGTKHLDRISLWEKRKRRLSQCQFY